MDDAGEIRGVYAEMLRAAADRLGLRLEDPPVLRVQSRAGLHANAGVPSAPDGLCGLYVRDAQGAPFIHVLAPLPRARLDAVLAHEIAHAWQAERSPNEQGARIREGFAEWVSWKLLEGREGGTAERRAIEVRTDVYGEGFRLFAALEMRDGADHAIWYAEHAANSKAATRR